MQGEFGMNIVFLWLVILLYIILSAVGVFEAKKIKGIVVTEQMRCKRYYMTITLLWSAALAILIMCFIGGISLEDIGLRRISFNYNIWFTAITLIVSGSAAALFLYKLFCSLVSEEYRKKMEKQVEEAEGVSDLLPRTKKEKGTWFIISFTAATCEEIIYRGFPVFLLQVVFPGIPVYLIIIIPSILFGAGHFYQGIKGFLGTAAIGALFTSLFLVTNSLFIVMLLHFIIDFSSTFIFSEK